MKQYKTRPGVVLTTIAGQYVLVAVKSLQDICPFSAQINETTAFCWRILEQGATLQTLTDALQKEYADEDPEELSSDLAELLGQLIHANYLIEEK